MKTSITINVERIIPGGRGLGFHEGRAVFVPFSVPGDRVRVLESRDRNSYLEVLVSEVIESAPLRIIPPCPYFGNCGGCDFQQMSYEQQLLSKKGILLDALKHIGKIDWPPSRIAITPSPPLNYRNRLQVKIVPSENDFSFGFYQTGSHRICIVDQCLISTEPLWNFLQALRQAIGRVPHIAESLDEIEILQGDGEEFLVNLKLKKELASWDCLYQDSIREIPKWDGSTFYVSLPSGYSHRVSGRGYIWKTVGEEKYRVSQGAFFQVNEPLLPALRDLVISDYSGKRALDLFCGVGFFSLALAKVFEEVLAVEVNPVAGLDLEENLRANRITNCRYSPGDVKKFLREEGPKLGAVDLILIDPPRPGLPQRDIHSVAGLGARDFVYVSCDPSTLARDLKILLSHDYRIYSLDLIDLFPQTHHLETVARLKK